MRYSNVYKLNFRKLSFVFRLARCYLKFETLNISMFSFTVLSSFESVVCIASLSFCCPSAASFASTIAHPILTIKLVGKTTKW
jgi:hypothetical protein